MATDDSTDPQAAEGSWSPRRSKKSSAAAPAQPAKDGAPPDPDALVEEIEKTREELAETLDAIADKVSPKRVAGRTKKAAKAGAEDAKEAVKQTAAEVAETVKGKVAEVTGKVSGDDEGNTLAPAAVELDPATPLPGAEVPREPAPTPGALADAAVVPVEPVGPDPGTAPYPTSLPPQSPSRLPLLAGAGAVLAVVLLVQRRRRRR